MRKIGIIGCGNMGGAILSGLWRNVEDPSSIICADASERARAAVAERYPDVTIAGDNAECAAESDLLILAVKPQFLDGVLADIALPLRTNTVVLSIVAGKKIEYLAKRLPVGTKIVRAMPNTPALVGKGMTAYCASEAVTEEEKAAAGDVLRLLGIAEEVPERLMDTVTGLSGSSPAFVYMMIEAMADGAVLDGMPRDMAYRFAAQTVFGSAAMVLETGKHPGVLKDMVTSPGGTTIEGIAVLEERGFRSALIEAVKAAADRSREL